MDGAQPIFVKQFLPIFLAIAYLAKKLGIHSLGRRSFRVLGREAS